MKEYNGEWATLTKAPPEDKPFITGANWSLQSTNSVTNLVINGEKKSIDY